MGERVASARGMLKVLQDNQRQLEAGDCCPTCRRGFASSAEKQQILATVAEEIQVGVAVWGGRVEGRGCGGKTRIMWL